MQIHLVMEIVQTGEWGSEGVLLSPIMCSLSVHLLRTSSIERTVNELFGDSSAVTHDSTVFF